MCCNNIFIPSQNDILGPSGFGEARFIAADTRLDYRIRFENEANATAPAQLVTITTSLDEDVDMATFQLGDFGFGNFTFDSNSRSAILQVLLVVNGNIMNAKHSHY